MQKEKPETIYLWWLDPATGKRYKAGVAFYEEGYGDYHLKIDRMVRNRFDDQYYLRASGGDETKVRYVMEKVIKDPVGNFKKKLEQCEAYFDPSTQDELIMTVPPFYMKLVVPINEKKENNNAA